MFFRKSILNVMFVYQNLLDMYAFIFILLRKTLTFQALFGQVDHGFFFE